LDPNFAQAHIALGAAYAMSGGSDDMIAEHFQKAYELRDRVSPRERFYIEGNYFEDLRGESSKALNVYKEWTETFPNDPVPHVNLSFIYGARGQWQDALTEGQVGIQLLPEAIVPRWVVEQAYLRLGDLSGAKRTFEETRAQNMDGIWLRYYRYIVAFAEGDTQTMQDQILWAAGRPGAEGNMLNTQAETEAYYGRFDRSRQYAEKAAASARRDGVPVSEVHWTVNMAWMAEEVGLQSVARELLLRVPSIVTGDEPDAAFVLARLGEVSQARNIADKVDRKYPFHEINHSYSIALTQAAIAMENKDPNRAIEALEVSKPHELGAGVLAPAYLRGLAFLQAGNPSKAAAEFQNIMAHPTLVDNRIHGALAHLQLGRAQVVMGDKNAARKSYQDFLTLWKDADSDIAIYQQAKAEYAKLQ
jgi:tetratricopeptide (TPR) repeat protein